MTQISNSYKQARFRRKEQLRKEADRIFRNWEISPVRWKHSRTPEDVRASLDKAVELPSGWTEDDFESAARKLTQYSYDLMSPVDQIAKDVNGDWDVHSKEFIHAAEPFKFFSDSKATVEKARALALHLISALKLSNCSDSEQAAALMEAARYVGISLSGGKEVHCSQATTLCMVSIGPQYDRPQWLARKLAETIEQTLDEGSIKEVARHLKKNNQHI